MALLVVGFEVAQIPHPPSKAIALTDCNARTLDFARVGSQRVVADFLGGRWTRDAGALWRREAARRLGRFEALNAVIPDPRRPELIEHEQQTMLAQRIITIALGSEDLNDHQTLRTDPAVPLAAAQEPTEARPLASPPPLCRLENRIDRTSLVRMAAVLVDQFIASHTTPPEALILDFDATDDPVHGHQEGRFFHGYYDHHCFLPLDVFCGEELFGADLRPSKIDAAKHARAILKRRVRRLRAAGPAVTITIRGDSGWCRWRWMRWCDHNGIGSVLGRAQNPVLRREAWPWIEAARWLCEWTGQPQRLFGTFADAAGTCSIAAVGCW